MITALISLIIPITMSFAENYWLALSLRIILGIANGLSACLGPLYVTETVTTKYRGRIGSLFQCVLTFGLFLAVS